jgi:hypothetical protein
VDELFILYLERCMCKLAWYPFLIYRCLGPSDIPRTLMSLLTMTKLTNCLQAFHPISSRSIQYQAWQMPAKSKHYLVCFQCLAYRQLNNLNEIYPSMRTICVIAVLIKSFKIITNWFIFITNWGETDPASVEMVWTCPTKASWGSGA